MGCCGGGSGSRCNSNGRGQQAQEAKVGGINWAQIVAVGLVLMFLLGILLQVWH